MEAALALGGGGASPGEGSSTAGLIRAYIQATGTPLNLGRIRLAPRSELRARTGRTHIDREESNSHRRPDSVGDAAGAAAGAGRRDPERGRGDGVVAGAWRRFGGCVFVGGEGPGCGVAGGGAAGG